MHVSLSVYVGIPVSRESIVVKTDTVQNMCTLGHISVLGAQYCSECGRRASLVDVEDFTPAFKTLCETNGSSDPRTGYEELSGEGWIVTSAEEGDSDKVNTYTVTLGSLSVESVIGERDIPTVYGLRILVAQIPFLGEGQHTASVLEMPLCGFQDQALVVASLAKMLGCEGSPMLYPQVYLG
jgi:hypothetical protein